MPALRFELNGRDISVDAPPETAVALLRDKLGFTGTKLVCETGGCGACTVLVDGVPTESCRLAATDLTGRTVVTIEGITPDVGLDPVQRALVAHDAIQCGFCIPGIVVAARAFVDDWASSHGTERPSADDVAAALDSHLCRCGGYPDIVGAVQAAAAGDFDDPAPVEGRPDAPAKVTGTARYTVDIQLPGMLHGRILRSSEPHADVVAVSTVAAQQVAGVEAIIDLLGKSRRVHYVGQPIAAVAATDLSAAKRAVAAIEVTYDLLPFAVGIEAARAPDAPDLIGRRFVVASNYEAAYFATTIPRRGNLRGPMSPLAKRRLTARKRVGAARTAGDDLLVEGTWTTASQTHAAPEPHAAVASWGGDSLTVYLSTQSVTESARLLAKHFGLNRQKVRVVAEYVGGAFGAKQGLCEPGLTAALLSQAASAPVRIAFDAAEELAYGGYRPGAQIDLAVLGSTEGELRAVTATAFMDGGDSAGQTVARTMRFSYPGPPMSLIDYDVVSNGAPAKPFHAPGAPVALFALETAIDELAERSGLDPIEMRRGWEPRSGRGALYEWAASHPLWLSRSDVGQSGAVLRGVGVAFGTWHYAYDPVTRVRVRTTESGLVVETGTQEIGTGTTHSLAAAVAGEFGLTSNDIEVRIGDSTLGHGPTTSASRTTPALVPTACAAASELRVGLVEFANLNLGLAGATAIQGGLDHAGEFIPWSELWPRLQGRSTTKKRPREDHFPVTPVAVSGAKLGWGITDVAHLVAVEVERSSGGVSVTDAATALAAGRIHTPQQAISGVHGSFSRGIGEALHEARLTDPATGIVTTSSYANYRLLRMSEMPNIEVTFLEDKYDYTPGGVSGIAELAVTSIPAAVANAVADATGWRPRRMPITPDDVVAGRRDA